MDKDALRADMRRRLATMRPMQRAQEEDLVNAAIVSDEDFAHARTVLFYKAIGTELSLVSASNAAWRAGKRVVFPRVASGALSLHEVEGWSALQPGAYGIPEPPEDAPVVSPVDVDVALVPGIAFTRAGKRLGQGGGFFDRLLPMLGGVSWGIAFDVQVVDEVPTEPHDRPVDRVLHPSGLAL